MLMRTPILQFFIKNFSKCSSNKLSLWCIMPKRSSQSLLQNKKIKLNEKQIDNSSLLGAKSNYSNLQSVCETPKVNSPEDDTKAKDLKEKKGAQEIMVKYLDTPDKSESDKKEYRTIKLENGLIALLVSDTEPQNEETEDTKGKACSSASHDESHSEESEEESEHSTDGESDGEHTAEEHEDNEVDGSKPMKKNEKMAACGLCINVGSFSDPLEIQGMAHFLEHMVFMGSEKFPEENDFDSFIRTRGGSDNASTDCEHTTFYFEIQEKHLLPAMDRFAQFFVSPLMVRDAISREREAVESEFKMGLPSDAHRKEQLISSFARENHPATKFPWGNLLTLRDNIEEDKLYSELHKFRERHYSAHRMRLTVQARLPLDVLEQYVKDCFSNVPVNHLPADDFHKFVGRNSFDTAEFPMFYKIKPIRDICQVDLTWVMPPLLHLYLYKPEDYVSHIIGHEGKGSLISYLRKKMWCIELYSGNDQGGFENSSMYTLFSLVISLTDEGREHIKEVLDAVFSYINMLRREGPQKRIFDEIQQIKNINFRFADEASPVDYVESLCENMHFYPPQKYITGSELYFEYDPDIIEDCINVLTPHDVNIILYDKKFNEEEFDKVEPWFQTKYSCSEIPDEWAESWEKMEPLPEFHLPEPNIFITDNFNLVDLPSNIPEYPEKIYHDDKIEIWYRVDPKFRLPDCYMYLYLLTPAAIECAESNAILNIFIATLKQLVAEELYDASVVQLSYEITLGYKGLLVKVNGFNQKLPLLLSKLIKYIADGHKLVTEELFNIMKKEQLKCYYNTFVKPSKLATEVGLSLITSNIWSSIEKHAAAVDVDFNHFKKFIQHFTDHFYVKCLVQGNMTQDEALKTILDSIKPLQFDKLIPDSYPYIRVVEVPGGEKCCRVKNFNPMDVNSVVTNYYQSGPCSIKTNVIIQLLMLIMEEPVFNQLRTLEQLGYSVYCNLRNTFGILGFSITVCTQANKFTTEYIDERIENFVKYIIDTLHTMSDEEYNFMKESLIKSKQRSFVYLKEEVEKNWIEIVNEKYLFDRFAREITAIECTKIDELREWMKDHTNGGKNFKKLSFQIVGTANPTDETKKNNESTGEEGTHPGSTMYSLTFLTDENDVKKKPLDYYVTDIRGFKEKLPLYPIVTDNS